MDSEQPPGLLPLSDGAALPSFDVALRGYDRRQVDEYLDRVEHDLAVAQSDREAAVERATVTEQRLDSLEKEVRAARQQLVESARPTYAGLGARVASLLRLAEEEAAQLRADALRDTSEIRQSADRLVAEARQRTAQLEAEFEAAMKARRQTAEKEGAAHRGDVERRLQAAEKRIAEADALTQGRITQASAEVDRRAKEAAAQVGRLHQDGERHAAALVQAARADADRLLTDARGQAERIVADAQTRADRRRAESEREVAELRARRANIDQQLATLREVLGGLPERADPADDEPTRPTPTAAGLPTAPPHLAPPTVTRSGSGG